MPQGVFVNRYRRAQQVTERQLREHYARDLSAHDKDRVRRLIDEVRDGRRAGYTYTGMFRFDVDRKPEMEHLYDRIGGRVVYAIGENQRPAALYDPDEDVISKTAGVAIWRDADGTVYADDVALHFDIPEDEALRIAKHYKQFSILKVDGKARTWSFINVPGCVVEIVGEGKDRSFDARCPP